MAVLQEQLNKNIILDQWLDIHFGDTSFNGRVVFCRKDQDGNFTTVGSRSLKKLKPYAKEIPTSDHVDYYLTANTMCNGTRRVSQLFGLQNIVIDVDCHAEEHIHSIPARIDAFIWRSKRDLWDTGIIPTPNSIVRTGRGVQLWWAIVPCYGGRDYEKSRYYHNKIKNTMIDYIASLLQNYEEELVGLDVDNKASSNLVGCFRLPYSYNTTAKRHGSLEVLHTKRYDQRDLIRMESFRPTIKTSSKAAHSKPRYVPMLESDRFVVRNFESAGVRRVLQLIKLRNLRNKNVGVEDRNDFNFSVYNALRMTFDHDQAMVRLKAYNSGFKVPMTDRELENCICSAHDKGGYKYTNEELIRLLKITPEEQVVIGLFPVSNKYKKKPNASRDEARRALKEDRDYKILEMVEKGISQAETARILGIGKNTVGRVLKRLRDTTTSDRAEAIAVPNTQESSRHHFGSIYVIDCPPTPATPGVRETRVVGSTEGGLFGMLSEDSS